jgi:hypothetical protein
MLFASYGNYLLEKTFIFGWKTVEEIDEDGGSGTLSTSLKDILI